MQTAGVSAAGAPAFASAAKRLRSVEVKCHDIETSLLEGVMARGDRRVGGGHRVGLAARSAGFDSWTEHHRAESGGRPWPTAAIDVDRCFTTPTRSTPSCPGTTSAFVRAAATWSRSSSGRCSNWQSDAVDSVSAYPPPCHRHRRHAGQQPRRADPGHPRGAGPRGPRRASRWCWPPGRRYSRTLHLVEPLGHRVPLVTASGALVKDPGDHRTLYRADFEPPSLPDRPWD